MRPVDQRHTNDVRFCNGTNVGLLQLIDDPKVELSMTWCLVSRVINSMPLRYLMMQLSDELIVGKGVKDSTDRKLTQ